MRKTDRPLVVANWKMNLSFNQTMDWCAAHLEQCAQLQSDTHTQVVLCPSFDAIAPVVNLSRPQGIQIGAQNCSSFSTGAYTGQVSAISLSQMGCTYCIIGHHECRTRGHETHDDIARKVELLAANGVTPIVCIGETAQDHKASTTHALTVQLQPLFAALARLPKTPIVIAYEPVGAIGTGAIPNVHELDLLFNWIAAQCTEFIPDTPCSLIYGGSVNEQSGAKLREIALLDGFLVGGASLDFQKLEKIVSLFKG